MSHVLCPGRLCRWFSRRSTCIGTPSSQEPRTVDHLVSGRGKNGQDGPVLFDPPSLPPRSGLNTEAFHESSYFCHVLVEWRNSIAQIVASKCLDSNSHTASTGD